MKKIEFWNKFKKGGVPFWQPWGCMGCLWRLLLFILLLLLLLALLSLFRKCQRCDESGDDVRDDDPMEEVADDTRTTEPGWNEPIADGEEVGLPAPRDNVLPPFEDRTPAPDPDDGGASEIYDDLLYVIFDSDAGDETFKVFAEKFTSLYPAPEHKIVYYNTGTKTSVLEVPKDKLESICSNLPEQIPDVEFMVTPIQVMSLYSPSVTPDDPAFSDADKSWYFKPIQAQQAWSVTQGSSDVIVGIVDSYMDLNHPELRGDRCLYPYSVIKNNSDVAPEVDAPEVYAGHGTMVTAVAVGNANNREGSSGIAPKCKFIPVSLGQYVNSMTEIEGLLYCMYHGADVVNLSCGSSFTDDITKMPIGDQIKFSETRGKRQEAVWDYVFRLAEKRGTTIVWSAGNSNCFSAMDASKRNHSTICVSAVDRNLHKADFSNFGNFEDLGLYESTVSAPGVGIWNALPDNSYDAWDGTSFSAPIITGVVALIKSQNHDLTTEQIIRILQATGKPIAGAPEIGKLVQIKDALDKAKSTVASSNPD